MGPVWCYWAFPMERYCGALQPAIRSRRFPYASIDRYVVEDAQLTQIKVVHNMAEELALRAPQRAIPQGAYACPFCELHIIVLSPSLADELQDPSCILLPPKSPSRPAPNLISGIAVALATRFGVSVTTVRPYLNAASVEEWGKIRRVDSDAGDTMCASAWAPVRDDLRDPTYVRVCLLFAC